MFEQRLIDANALLERIEERMPCCSFQPLDMARATGYKEVMKLIAIAPTVEVSNKQKALKPLNIEDHYLAETYDYDYSNAECPCCKAGFSFDEYHRSSYCSECGAKFDWSEE